MRIQAGPLELELAFGSAGLSEVKLPPELPVGLTRDCIQEALCQLSRYSLDWNGYSVFQRKVWAFLRSIPSGSVMTYGAVARAIGAPGAARAVGSACAMNPLLLVVPCHRVVAQNGLGGFRAGMEWKRALLEMERMGVSSNAFTEPQPIVAKAGMPHFGVAGNVALGCS